MPTEISASGSAAKTDESATGQASNNRVSLRAVLAFDGEDVAQALSQAGIFDPVAVPAILGDANDPPGGILGDGITPNLFGKIEPDDVSPGIEAHATSSEVEWPSDQPVTVGARAAGDMRPFAPMRRRRT